jgi:hypothetical protein
VAILEGSVSADTGLMEGDGQHALVRLSGNAGATIALRAVKHHLAKLFRKVGVTSRTQLAHIPEFAGAGLR